MRLLILISFLSFTNLSIFGQDLFKIGLEYFEHGKYSSADSIFSILLEKSPNDKNALYNHGSARFYMGDTCKFCDVMLSLCHSYQEMDACNLYFKICGIIDTLYFDNKYLKCGKKEARYTEMIETHKNEDFRTVFVHDKKEKGRSVITNADYMNPIKTDIIASYKLFNDSTKLFLFTIMPPTFQNGKEAYNYYIENNPYTKECKRKLNLNKVVVGVEYIVGRFGNISDIKITDISTPNDHFADKFDLTNMYKKTTVDDMETLSQYINLIVDGMPPRIPGKYRDENVDYLVDGMIVFW